MQTKNQAAEISSSGNTGSRKSEDIWEAYGLLKLNTYAIPIQFKRQIEATAELVKILAQEVDNYAMRLVEA